MKPQDRFTNLYEEHQSLVRGVLYNLVGNDCDDLIQDVFIKVWKGLPTFAFKSSLKTWIYRVTTNVALDHLRKKKLSTVTYEDRAAAETPQTNDNAAIIQEEIQKLSEESSTVIVLYYFENLSTRDIAKILKLAEGTVKSRLFNARKQLEPMLLKRGIEL